MGKAQQPTEQLAETGTGSLAWIRYLYSVGLRTEAEIRATYDAATVELILNPATAFGKGH